MMNPEDFVVEQFSTHTVVLLGEMHYCKHDPELVGRLIPRLVEADVWALGFEYARREDQPLIDRLLTQDFFDDSLARLILLKFLNWGYLEYLKIFRSAWDVNRTEPRFQILGLNDSPNWGLLQSAEDWKNAELRKAVWSGGGEALWAQVVLDEVRQGRKVLVYCGLNHAFPRYLHLEYDKDGCILGEREPTLGNYLYRELGDAVYSIALHCPWPSRKGYGRTPQVLPADGVLDERLSSERNVAFAVRGTRWGELTAKNSLYSLGCENLVLQDLVDGYVYAKPFQEYESVTPIKDFIGSDNVEEARARASDFQLRTGSVEDFNTQSSRQTGRESR
jgi:hypothetical protein